MMALALCTCSLGDKALGIAVPAGLVEIALYLKLCLSQCRKLNVDSANKFWKS